MTGKELTIVKENRDTSSSARRGQVATGGGTGGRDGRQEETARRSSVQRQAAARHSLPSLITLLAHRRDGVRRHGCFQPPAACYGTAVPPPEHEWTDGTGCENKFQR